MKRQNKREYATETYFKLQAKRNIGQGYIGIKQAGTSGNIYRKERNMKLKIIVTGSLGNSALLTDNNGRILMLDAGATQEQILRSVDYKISLLDGVLVSHQHL